MSGMRSRLPALATFVLSAALLLVTAPAAAVSGWKGPTAILAGHHVERVFVGAATDGSLAIVGRDEEGLFHLTDRSGPWRRTLLVPAGQLRLYPWDQFAAVFDRAGHAYVAWSRPCAGDDCSRAGIWYRDDASGAWSKAKRLVRGDVSAPAIQLRDGATHLVYLDRHSRLHYRLLRDGGWVDGLVWPGESSPASLAVGAGGVPHIVAVRPGWGLAWARHRMSGASIDFAVKRVPIGPLGVMDVVSGPVIALDADGRPSIAWARESVCGVPPCDVDTLRGTWTVDREGSSWGPTRHVSLADPVALRITPAGRVRLLTDRPSLVRETADGFRTAVLASRVVVSEGLALTPAGKARVVYAKVVKEAGRRVSTLFLLRER